LAGSVSSLQAAAAVGRRERKGNDVAIFLLVLILTNHLKVTSVGPGCFSGAPLGAEGRGFSGPDS